MFTFSKPINNKIANQNLFASIFIMGYCILQAIALVIMFYITSIDSLAFFVSYIFLAILPFIEAFIVLILAIIGRFIFTRKKDSKAYRILMLFQHIFTIFPFLFISLRYSIHMLKYYNDNVNILLVIAPVLCTLITLCCAIFGIRQNFFEKTLDKPKKV
ncbi:MAG: hypothetical protein IJZ64_07380 [Ruminococcus sp.]|nr:hypothetical protein [Ruminococcus sp.]